MSTYVDLEKRDMSALVRWKEKMKKMSARRARVLDAVFLLFGAALAEDSERLGREPVLLAFARFSVSLATQSHASSIAVPGQSPPLPPLASSSSFSLFPFPTDPACAFRGRNWQSYGAECELTILIVFQWSSFVRESW